MTRLSSTATERPPTKTKKKHFSCTRALSQQQHTQDPSLLRTESWLAAQIVAARRRHNLLISLFGLRSLFASTAAGKCDGATRSACDAFPKASTVSWGSRWSFRANLARRRGVSFFFSAYCINLTQISQNPNITKPNHHALYKPESTYAPNSWQARP
jgi:hypothetical protein